MNEYKNKKENKMNTITQIMILSNNIEIIRQNPETIRK